MRRTFLLTTITVVLLLLSLGGLVATTSARATDQTNSIVPSTMFTPVPGGPAYSMISVTAFQANNPQETHAVYGGPFLYTQAGSGSYEAPLVLPDRVRITGMTVYYHDMDLNGALTAQLYKLDLCASRYDALATVSTQNEPPRDVMRSLSNVTISQPVVDLRCAAYSIHVSLPPGTGAGFPLRLYGVRIDYGFATALPAVVK